MARVSLQLPKYARSLVERGLNQVLSGRHGFTTRLDNRDLLSDFLL